MVTYLVTIASLIDKTTTAPVNEIITILKKERAQNLTIAKRRIGHTPTKVAKFIENTDLVGLPGELCELLLRGDLGIASKEEVILLKAIDESFFYT